MARPRVKIDLTELEKLCAMQCTDEEIGAFFGVSARTIERRRKVQRFSDVMEHAKAKGKVSVRRNLFRLAGNGNVAAALGRGLSRLPTSLCSFLVQIPSPMNGDSRCQRRARGSDIAWVSV